MTRQEKIEELQDKVWHNKISNIDDLRLEISCAEYDGEEVIEPIDDILAPIGFTYCDRCGEVAHIEGLSDKEASDMLEECYQELNKIEESK